MMHRESLRNVLIVPLIAVVFSAIFGYFRYWQPALEIMRDGTPAEATVTELDARNSWYFFPLRRYTVVFEYPVESRQDPDEYEIQWVSRATFERLQEGQSVPVQVLHLREGRLADGYADYTDVIQRSVFPPLFILGICLLSAALGLLIRRRSMVSQPA